MDEWVVALDEGGQPYVVRVVPDSRIGPFRDLEQATMACAELMAAGKKGTKQ